MSQNFFEKLDSEQRAQMDDAMTQFVSPDSGGTVIGEEEAPAAPEIEGTNPTSDAAPTPVVATAPVATTPVNTTPSAEAPTPVVATAPVATTPVNTPATAPSATGNENGVLINIRSVKAVASTHSCGKEREIQIAGALGLRDMNEISKDVLAALGNARLRSNEIVKSIRIEVYSSGNKVVRDGELICDLKVPSGTSSGVKLQLSSALEVQANRSYLLQFPFIYDRAVISRGNGLCNLHPQYALSVRAN